MLGFSLFNLKTKQSAVYWESSEPTAQASYAEPFLPGPLVVSSLMSSSLTLA